MLVSEFAELNNWNEEFLVYADDNLAGREVHSRQALIDAYGNRCISAWRVGTVFDYEGEPEPVIELELE